MTTILVVEASPRGAASASRAVAAELVARLCAGHPGAQVVLRDVAHDPPPFVDAAFTEAMYVAAADRTPAEAAALACSEALIAELDGADIVVVSTPMHNFTVPAPLKAWIDQIVRARRSFRIAPEGKIGLLRDRPVFVVSAAGGIHAGAEARQPDFLTPYLRTIFETIGLRSVEFLAVQGVARDPDRVAEQRRQAMAWIDARLPPVDRRAALAPP